MGLDPVSIITSIATNLATDIIKQYAQRLDHTWVGQQLKALGLIEETRDDHLREIVKESLRLYLQTHPNYDLTSVETFFRDPAVVQQIGNYIFDNRPLDQRAIEDALARTVKKDVISMTLMQRRGASPEQIIPEFLKCYRQVLNRSVDAPEKAILLALLDATDTIVGASHADAQQTQAMISQAALQQMQILQGNPYSLTEGQIIGQYRIQKELTRGTFGTLYLAAQQQTGTLVAVKVIRVPNGLSLHDDVFSLEKKLLILNHPSIIPTIDVRTTEVPPYIVSAFINGKTLQQRIQHNAPHPLQLDEAIGIVTQIGQAVSYLHRQRILHRGIQPAAILFDETGSALLTGFDLAIEIEKQKHRLQLNYQGAISYAAPEQESGVFTEKSDQYSLACIAYQLCTGRLPSKDRATTSSSSRHQTTSPLAPPYT
jgi:hypothetical protein